MTWHHLTSAERMQISVLWSCGKNYTQIAKILGRARSTIAREIKRGSVTVMIDCKKKYIYNADYSDSRAETLSHNKGRKIKIFEDLATAKKLRDLIKNRKNSPYAALCRLEKSNEPYIKVCVTTLYRYIYAEILGITAENDLIYGRYKQTYKTPFYDRKNCWNRVGGHSIELRPKSVLNRDEFGHWECDTVVSARGGKAALLTIVERKTRFLVSVFLPARTQSEVKHALNQIELQVPFIIKSKDIFKSITVDNGSEFLDGNALALSVYEDQRDSVGMGGRTDIYYCHVFASSERGSNENIHRMIRRKYPKSTIFDNIDKNELYDLIDYINDYPRPIFDGDSARDRFECEIKKLCDRTGNKLLPERLFGAHKIAA